MKKRILSFLLVLVMVLGMVPVNLFAVSASAMEISGTEVPVVDNVIDITDKTIASLSKYYANTVSVAIDGASIKQAFEDGLNIYVVLESGTPADATVNVSFNTTVNKFTVEGNTGSVTLSEGAAELSLTLDAKYNGRVSYGKATYKLFFQAEVNITEAPTRLQETDSASTYNGVALNLNVSQYFQNAQTYYLVEGETKTQLDGKNYTFLAQEGGEYTLVFAAANAVGECPDLVTVTVNVTAIESGIWIGKESSNGSMNYVLFSDAEGNPIDGLQVAVEGTTIRVNLPKNYPVNGSVKASFNLTQNGDVPFITTKTGTSGTASGKAVSNKFTEKTVTLSGGAATFTFYYYNITPTTTNNPYETWSLVYTMANDLPVLAEGVEATKDVTITAGQTYELDLAPIFTDVDGDALTYKVSVNGAAAAAADVNYTYTTDVAGTYTLVFTANDSKGDSAATYTVNLTVENVKETDGMSVTMPEGLAPKFYVSPGFEGGIDQLGDEVEAVEGETVDGMTTYTVNYPTNATMLSVRTENWGGMAFPVEKDGSVSLRQAQVSVVDYENNPAASTNTVTYDGNTAVAGSEGWLLVTGTEYVFTAVPVGNADLETVSVTQTLAAGDGIYTVEMTLGIKNPLAITVPTGATVNVYKYNKYYDNTELPAKIVKDNGNGTTTFQYVADTKEQNNTAYIYRVAMEGKITKSGWLAWNQQNLTITYTDADKAPDYRLDDYSGTGAENSGMAEDSVLLNINSRNHLKLDVGQSKTLKAYRAWEIIPISYQNYIITPDFTYTILSGEDVVKLTPKDSKSAGEGDWMTLTALKDGIAIIEVTYDAVEVSGGSYDGVFGASDPARTGLVVVQVGGNDDTSVQFGIDGFASAGISGSDNIRYNPNNKKAWDAEFDTLYFTGKYGELNFAPTANSSITEVAVSNDKGATWTTLTADDGVYTAKIVSGNNILRVKTAEGTAYQIVRGDKITVKLKELDGKSDGDGIVEAGESVRVTLVGLHNPIPKMAGNYNPGYYGNTDGFSSQHLNYKANGEEIHGVGAQYNFITTANYVDIVMPEDGSSVTLTDGYIGLGVIGLTAFADGGDSHRNIPDGGCATRGSQTTYHTRSVLPQITVSVGNTTAPNGAPIVRTNAITEGSIYTDQKFAINPDTLFADPDDDAMTFTVSVNGAEAVEAPLTYKFEPAGVGTYTLVFTATDGKLTATHTVTVTVTERPQVEEPEPDFGLDASEIAGYVMIGFEDKGIRVAGEAGLKFPEPLGDIIPLTKVPYKQGERISHVTQRLLEHLGMRMSYTGSLNSGFYLGAIYNFEVDGVPYDSMGEFDAGTGSGWMITQNDVFINMGASEFAVKDGDVIQWKYTCQLGADIGDTYYTAAKDVMDLIDAIGTVTVDSSEAIQAARAAYDALDENQKKKVANYDVLEAAEAAYAQLVKTAADEATAKSVEKQITAIGTVTLKKETAIQAARAAYEALTAVQKLLVKNLDVLEKAEETLEVLKKPAPTNNFREIYTTTGDYLEKLVKEYGLTVNSTGGEWIVIGLERAGRELLAPEAYYEEVVKFVRENANEKQQLHRAKSTENSRVILALTALGYDVTDVDGHNLLVGLNDMTYLQKQGINGPMWALIALDSKSYAIPAGGNVTREALIQVILDKQLPDGGWTLSGDTGDTDMTAMALTALAPYYKTNAPVKAAVDKALLSLSNMQHADGGFGSVDGANAESAAQVIVALTALGMDPHTDSRFVKNGRSVVDALCDYYVAGGGFKHVASMDVNGMATEQSYYALVAYFRFLEEKTSLFDMNNVTVNDENPVIPEETPKEESKEETEEEPKEDPKIEPEKKPEAKPQQKPEKPAEQEKPAETVQPTTKLEVIPGGITQVPEELQKTGLETVEDVKAAIERAILWENEKVDKKNIAHYDVQLMYTEDGGKTWTKADKNHFPENGKLTVTLPYPEGTDSSYIFTVVHMFTSDAFGKTPGDVEMPQVTNTPEGIQFEVTGLSPISVGWTAPVAEEAPQTMDPVDVTPQVTTVIVIVLVGIAGLAVLLIALRKRNRASK